MKSMNGIKVIIAEDHQLVRCGIKLLLETDPNIHIAGEAVSGKEVLQLLRIHKDVDIILTDFHMPDMSGMEMLQQLQAENQASHVVFLTMVEDQKTVNEAFENGVVGYLTKDISADELIFAINHIFKGGKYISANLSHRFLIKSLQVSEIPQPLTPEVEFNSREIQVMGFIAEGLTNDEMGEKLFLSKRTVEGHRRALIDKTKTRNSAALIKYAVTYGLIK